MNTRQTTGRTGESLACNYLQANGYTIIAQNWQSAHDEIDIIAQVDTQWVFVEVRTRRTRDESAALASISPAKQQKMIRAAYRYLHANHLPEDTLWRIDVIAVSLWNAAPPKIEHIPDALTW
ncbi:MAG: YraN family protein [Phototrophicaceae bacterium]